jgi:transposase, IS5 family
VLRLTAETGRLVERFVREARRLLAELDPARQDPLERVVQHAERVADQIRMPARGERISDRLVSLADRDARPIRKGKLGTPTEFGYVTQLAEITSNTRRGTRGYLLPPALRVGSSNETDLLPDTVAALDRLDLHVREAALDGGFPTETSRELLSQRVAQIHITGRAMLPTPKAGRRTASYRVGCEARIAYLKRRYGLRRTRVRGHQGARIWTG